MRTLEIFDNSGEEEISKKFLRFSMKTILIFAILLITVCSESFSRDETSNWILKDVGLTFNTPDGEPVIIPRRFDNLIDTVFHNRNLFWDTEGASLYFRLKRKFAVLFRWC